MTFTAVVTAHAESPHRILGNLMYQTRKPDETLAFLSDVPPAVFAELREDFPEVVFSEVPNRNDWGHAKRAQGIEMAAGDYVGFFNHDDEYELDYIEKMMRGAEAFGSDVIYCGWTGQYGNPTPSFALGSSTSGNFIARTELAREAGYESRAYEADGYFIEALRNRASVVEFVDEVLYHHH